jgi:hypothetical protein
MEISYDPADDFSASVILMHRTCIESKGSVGCQTTAVETDRELFQDRKHRDHN